MNSYHIQRNVGRGRRNNNDGDNGTLLLIRSLIEPTKECSSTYEESTNKLVLVATPNLAPPGAETPMPEAVMKRVLEMSDSVVAGGELLKNALQNINSGTVLEGEGISALAPEVLLKTNTIIAVQLQWKQQSGVVLRYPVLGHTKETVSQGNQIHEVFEQNGNPVPVLNILTSVSIMLYQKTTPKYSKSVPQDNTLVSTTRAWRTTHQHAVGFENPGCSIFNLNCVQFELKLIKSPELGDNCKLQITTMLAVCPWQTNKMTATSASRAGMLDWTNDICLTGRTILGSRTNTCSSDTATAEINDEKSLLSIIINDLSNMRVANSGSEQFIDDIFAPATKLHRLGAITTKMICESPGTTCSTFKKNKDNSDTALSGNPPYTSFGPKLSSRKIHFCYFFSPHTSIVSFFARQ